MQIDLERSFAPAGQCRGIVERFFLQHEMMHRFTLTFRQSGNRGLNPSAPLVALDPGRNVHALIGMAFVCQRRMHFARAVPMRLTQHIDGAPFGDHAQPGIERAPRIVGRARPVDRQQRFLNHIIAAIGWHAAPTRYASNERYAVAQEIS